MADIVAIVSIWKRGERRKKKERNGTTKRRRKKISLPHSSDVTEWVITKVTFSSRCWPRGSLGQRWNARNLFVHLADALEDKTLSHRLSVFRVASRSYRYIFWQLAFEGGRTTRLFKRRWSPSTCWFAKWRLQNTPTATDRSYRCSTNSKTQDCRPGSPKNSKQWFSPVAVYKNNSINLSHSSPEVLISLLFFFFVFFRKRKEKKELMHLQFWQIHAKIECFRMKCYACTHT